MLLQPYFDLAFTPRPARDSTMHAAKMSRVPITASCDRVPAGYNGFQKQLDALSGPGEIIAVDNGDATSFEPFQACEHSAFNGLCLVIARSIGRSGQITVKASSPSLRSAVIKYRAH